MMKVALYVRVSESVQNPVMQINDLIGFCKANKYEIYKHKCLNPLTYKDMKDRYTIVPEDLEAKRQTIMEYKAQGIFIDYGYSGTKESRPEFLELMEGVSTRQFDAVLVWSVDRFSREGIKKLFKYISYMEKNKVDFISYKEQFINTIGPMKEMMLAMLSLMAKLESDRQGERVKAGIARAKRLAKEKGKDLVWGTRHTFSIEAEQRMKQLRSEGLGYLKISKKILEEMNIKVFPASIRYYLLSLLPEKESANPEIALPENKEAL